MPYPKVNWQNGEAGGTPLNAENLNIMDNGIKANEDAITQNTADIEELKNKPTTALILTSASPLPNTTESSILGIDVAGKSEQETTQTLATVQGGLTSSSVGYSINQAVKSNTTRCVTDVFAMTNGSTITVSSGYQFYTLHAETEDGLIDEVTGWRTSLTLSKGGYYRFLIKNDSGTDLTPSQFTLTAEGIAPTPTNPIPIVDASGEIIAHTSNILDVKSIAYTTNTLTSYSLDEPISVKGIKAWAQISGIQTIKKIAIGESITVSVDSISTSNGAVQIGLIYDDGTSKLETLTSSALSKTITATKESTQLRVTLIANASGSALSADVETTIRGLRVNRSTTATDYVPFESNSITLPITLRSVGTIADTLVINKDGSGKLTQNIERKKFSELGYNAYDSGNTRFVFNVSNVMIAAARTLPMLCDCYTAITDGRTIPNVPTNSIYSSGDGTRLYVHDYSTTDGSTLLASIGNMYVYYPLQNPIVTDLTAEQVASILALRTYKGTTIIDAELDVNSVTYSGDVKGYVDDASAAMALNSIKVTRNIPSIEAGEITYTIPTPAGFPYSEHFKYKAYIVQAGAFIPFRLNSVTCTSTYISVSVTFPDGVSGAGTLELLLYWDDYKPIDVAPIAMVMSVDEGGAAE